MRSQHTRRERERGRTLDWRKTGAVTGFFISASLFIVVAVGAQFGRKMPDEGRGHVEEGTAVKYGHYPPTSGPHWPTPAPWGDYEQEIPPEIWVHNLEHGGVVILYRCDTPCPDLVRSLREAYATFPESKWGHVKLLIAPARKLKSRLAILAWTWIDEMESFDRERLVNFYRAHLDRAPEDVP